MKTLLLRLLSLLTAAALGAGLTIAILQRKAAPPAPSVAAPTMPSIPLVLAEAAEPLKRNELAGEVFAGYHEAVVADFVARPGFGSDRILPHPGFPSFQNSSFSRFDFTFIGNDPAMRKYQVADSSLAGRPLVFRIGEAIARREKERHEGIEKPRIRQEEEPALSIDQMIDKYQRLANEGSDALFAKDLKPDVSLPTEEEFAILAQFEATPEKMIEFHAVADGTLGYGALRATATCLQCHEKEEGALLGLFRYRFKHGPTGWVKDLAAK